MDLGDVLKYLNNSAKAGEQGAEGGRAEDEKVRRSVASLMLVIRFVLFPLLWVGNNK